MAGLTNDGFTPKTTEEIQNELRSNLIQAFQAIGDDINTSPSSRFGQLVDIFSSEIQSVWSGLEDVYNSFYPLTSIGTSLDKANSLVNVSRLQPRSSTVDAYLLGDSSQPAIPANTQFSVTGSNYIFAIGADSTSYPISSIVTGITVNKIATSGTIQLIHDSNIATIDFDDTASEIQTKLEALPSLSAVTVIGNFDGTSLTLSETPTFVYIKLDGVNSGNTQITVGDNLLLNGTETLTETRSDCSENPVPMLSVDLDAIQALRGTLVTAVDSVSGLVGSFNVANAVEGRQVETDNQYRVRRYETLNRSGTATANGIRQTIVDAIGADLYNVTVVENDTSSNADGVISQMPPHSFEVFVNASSSFNNDIAQAIYDSKSVGIEAVSTDGLNRTGTYTDVNGDEQTMPFSSTTNAQIYITVKRSKNEDYPDDGDDQIKSNLLQYFNNFLIGDDVYHHKLYTPINNVNGIIDLEVLLGRSPSPAAMDNIEISAYETAVTQTGNIVISDLS